MKLHLGCGEIHLDGWTNIDCRHTPAADRVMDIAHLEPGAFGEPIEAIYACHVLEHFGFACALPTAAEVMLRWARLLRPGGTLFISVPNLRAIGAAIASTDSPLVQWNFTKAIYGGCEYPTNRHFIGFTPELLAEMMRATGLQEIGPFEPFAEDTSKFVLHGVPISLNLKGRRPL